MSRFVYSPVSSTPETDETLDDETTTAIESDGESASLSEVDEERNLVNGSKTFSKTKPLDQNDVGPKNDDQLERARQLLYFSHFFNQFSEQAWQFCIALFLAAFTNNQSLILVTTYGLVTYSFVCLFGSSIGRYIDHSNRLTVARQFIGLENLAVLTATLMCYALLSRNPDEMSSEALYNTKSIVLLVSIHLLGAVAMILDSGFLVAVERDWIVVMSIVASKIRNPGSSLAKEEEETIQKTWLSDTNVRMRQIDLSCKIIAPALSGLWIGLLDDGSGENHGYRLRGAALMVGGINVVALVVEYVCTAMIYHQIPELAEKSVETPPSECPKTVEIAKSDESTASDGEETDELIGGAPSQKSDWTPKLLGDLRVYFSQSICWAGFALALLYLNVVLSFGNTMTVYLVWRGIELETIGIWRGVASAAGLAGTFVYHIMAKRIGLVDVGMISVAFEFVCLSVCFGSLFLPSDDSFVFFALLIAGVCFSRIGLWVFDISVTQLMQLHVPADVRGRVGGVQQSLNAFFTVVIYVAGLFLSDPDNFRIYASISFAGVTFAMVFYGAMVFARRNLFGSEETGHGKESPV